MEKTLENDGKILKKRRTPQKIMEKHETTSKMLEKRLKSLALGFLQSWGSRGGTGGVTVNIHVFRPGNPFSSAKARVTAASFACS